MRQEKTLTEDSQWTVIGPIKHFVLAECSCGKQKIKQFSLIRNGKSKSCGCKKVSNFLKAMSKKPNWLGDEKYNRKHRIYQTWTSMIQRTTNKNSCRAKNYIERGITVCDEWLTFKNFRGWALQNGYRDDLTIDRINNNGNYEPDNCRFSDRIQQANNTTATKYVSYLGTNIPRSEFARMFNITASRIFYLHKTKGMTGEEIIDAIRKRETSKNV